MSLETSLEKKKNQLNGTLITDIQISTLKSILPKKILPDWYILLLQKFHLSGVFFSLDDEYDQSEMGVDLKWFTPEQTADEALNAYPGMSVVDLGYLPVGSCLAGSGDPYFLKLKDDSSDPALVRVPHDFASAENYPEDKIELVCSSLSDFFEQANID